MNGSGDDSSVSTAVQLKLKKLDVEQVMRIDEMLDSIGEFGEVHLVVQHGELKYINRMESQKAGKRRAPIPGE